MNDLVPRSTSRGGAEELSSLRAQWESTRAAWLFFRRLFEKEYIHSLLRFHKWDQEDTSPKVQPNDVVLVQRKGKVPVRYWPLARVLKVIPSSKDGIIRTVQLRMHGKTFFRHTRSIAPLQQTNELRRARFQSDIQRPSEQVRNTLSSTRNKYGVTTGKAEQKNAKPSPIKGNANGNASSQQIVTRSGRTVNPPPRFT